MTIDPRTPVLVAVGEVTNRSATVVDPIELATEATRRAFADAGVPIGHRIDTVATPGILMIGRDHPASRIAEAAGLRAHRRISCPVGGNTPQYLAGMLGQDIICGQVDAALIVGAEAGNSARRGRAAGTLPVAGPVEGHDETLGDARPGSSAIEMGAGLHWPHEVYPIFESAMAARAGRTLDEQRVWLGRLMAPFTTEAARHPDQAWFPTERTPEELSTVTADNRMVCEPYTKLLNSILTVDMAAAFVIMAAEVAQDLQIPRDRWVFSWASGDVQRRLLPGATTRPVALRRYPGRRSGVLAAAGIGLDDVSWFDLYSCFPAAVEAAVDALGLEATDPRFHRHGWPAVPRWSGQQLCQPLDRRNGPTVPGGSEGRRDGVRTRLVHHQALGRVVVRCSSTEGLAGARHDGCAGVHRLDRAPRRRDERGSGDRTYRRVHGGARS